MRFFLLWIAAIHGASSQHAPVLPANIASSSIRPAEHAYTATVYVGAPPEETSLEVRFDVAGLWIYRDQSIHSAAHVIANDGSESDVIYFGGTRQRCRTHHGVPRVTSPLLCGECTGVLGLRADSSLWQWWPDASFTPASITFGGLAPPLRDRDSKHTWDLPCENGDDEWSLCTVRVRWQGSIYRAELSLNSPYLSAPRHARDAYLEGKNIYDKSEPWDPLELEFVDAVPRSPGGASGLSVSFSRDDLSGQHGSEARELLIDIVESRNDTFVLGSALLRKLVLYRTGDRQKIVAHVHPIFSTLPIENSILFLVVFWFYVRWKMTDLGKHYARSHERRTRVRAVDLTYQILGWGVSIAAVFLPSTWEVLQDLPGLHGVAGTLVFLGIAVEIVARVILALAQRNRVQKPQAVAFLIVLIESLWHEAVLTTAMWLLVIPRRREDLAGPLSAVAAAASIYSVVVHGVFLFVFIAVCGPKSTRRGRRFSPLLTWFSLFAIVSVLALGTYWVILFVWFFTMPLLHRLAAIYAELAAAVVAATAGLLFLGGVAMADAYITRAVQISAKQHIEASAAKAARPREEAGTIAERWDPIGGLHQRR